MKVFCQSQHRNDVGQQLNSKLKSLAQGPLQAYTGEPWEVTEKTLEYQLWPASTGDDKFFWGGGGFII